MNWRAIPSTPVRDRLRRLFNAWLEPRFSGNVLTHVSEWHCHFCGKEFQNRYGLKMHFYRQHRTGRPL
jgi:hypothetical protein